MIERYPHTATIQIHSAPTKDADGVYTESGAPAEETVNCRFEPAGSGAGSGGSVYKSNEGNATMEYRYKVFMHNQDFDIPNKSTIVWNGETMTIEGVDVFQNHTVLWV